MIISNTIITVTSDAVRSSSHLSSSSSGITDRLANHFIYLQLQIAQDLFTTLDVRDRWHLLYWKHYEGSDVL